jgi:hypothetical protein
MDDASLLIALTGTGAAGLAVASAAILRAWTQWLELRAEQLRIAPPPKPAAAGELRTLRERVRRLEAIADGAQS